jgi:hypothetical protein
MTWELLPSRVFAIFLIICSCCVSLSHAIAQTAYAPAGISPAVFNYENNFCNSQYAPNEILWGQCMRMFGNTVRYSDSSVGGPIVTPPQYGLPNNIIQGRPGTWWQPGPGGGHGCVGSICR